MPLPPLPDDVEAFDGLNWDAIAPYFDALLNRPLTADNTAAWLAEWSHLDALLSVPEQAIAALQRRESELEAPNRLISSGSE